MIGKFGCIGHEKFPSIFPFKTGKSRSSTWEHEIRVRWEKKTYWLLQNWMMSFLLNAQPVLGVLWLAKKVANIPYYTVHLGRWIRICCSDFFCWIKRQQLEITVCYKTSCWIKLTKRQYKKTHSFFHEISPVTWGQAERQRAQLQQKNGSALRRQNEQRQCCFFFRILARFFRILSGGVTKMLEGLLPQSP